MEAATLSIRQRHRRSWFRPAHGLYPSSAPMPARIRASARRDRALTGPLSVLAPLTTHRQFAILPSALIAEGPTMNIDQLKRREFLALLGGSAVAWPLAVRGQQGERMRRIGVLMNLSEDDREGQA